ncbi:arabinose ABC transporter permease [Acidovorax sp. Leaf76]|uniref:MFS transporter n=1 Tax=unclassified Acidovorax TaxID=2684926 RepID=UPI0007016379|nr:MULTISPECIES: MFS transporter [unclassified Acidovorax]KQO13921.1 arabinose ABC transporter permease [Acidovorax sp. Leaf76]KQO31442.1 arabinose ABC transporter permease [Acidovorax sp. Leaf84]KQS27462.1 arabinose ABC transporter permease [Acidovorax sp. Leaf191]
MSQPSTSLWSPLRQPAFRGLWVCGGVFFIGSGMQTMAAAWLMVELTGSSFLAALVQTAVFMPMFLLALPAGVLADTTDRRRLISGALLAQVGASALLTLLVLGGWGGPASVLFLVFICGCCTAVLTPAWNSSVIDPVPRDEWPQAITAVSIAYNAARAIGPTLAGLVFAQLGAGWVFAVTVTTTLVMWESIRRWPPKAHPPSKLPAERLWGGTLSGLRFAWHSRIILAQLVRVMAFSAAGSALWALLPVIAQRLGTGAPGFGLLMGCLGTGAVAVGLVLGRLRARFGMEIIVGVGGVVFAAAMLVAAMTKIAWVVYIAMLFAGAAWMSAMSTFNTATQASAPQWVRSRAVAMHMVAALGAFAMGSAFWGAASDIVGLAPTLYTAAALMGAGLLLARPMPLRMGALHEVTQATPWDELFIEAEPLPEAGPVAVEVGYRIAPGTDAEFLDTISRMKAPRRRDGATFWRVYKDLGEPSRYVERFIVESWADYLHQRARATMADQALETEVRAFLAPGEVVRMSHYIAER